MSLAGGLEALYASGCGDGQPRAILKRQPRSSARLDLIEQMLKEHGPMSYREVARKLGLSPEIVKNARYMNLLVKQERIRIISWRRGKAGPMQAVYAAGQGQSAPRPKAFSRSEVDQRCREKKRALTRRQNLVEQLIALRPC